MWKKILTVLLTASVVLTAVPAGASVLTTSGDQTSITASDSSPNDVSGLTTDSESESVSNSISISQDGSSITVDSTDDAIMTDDSESDEEDSDTETDAEDVAGSEDEDKAESADADETASADSSNAGGISVTNNATETDTGAVSDGAVEVTTSGSISAEGTLYENADDMSPEDYEAFLKEYTVTEASQLESTDKMLELNTVFFNDEKYEEAKDAFKADEADTRSDSRFVYDMMRSPYDSADYGDVTLGGDDEYPSGYLHTNIIKVLLTDSDDEDYYEADLTDYLNTSVLSDKSIADYDFHFGSNAGIIFDDVIFDEETNIVKIPKTYFDTETVQKNIDATQEWSKKQGNQVDYPRISSQIAMDVIIPVTDDEYVMVDEDEVTPTSDIHVTVDNCLSDVTTATVEDTITVSSFADGITFPLVSAETADKLDADDIHVYINGVEDTTSGILTYEDGYVTVFAAPSGVTNLDIRLGDGNPVLTSLMRVPMRISLVFKAPKKAASAPVTSGKAEITHGSNFVYGGKDRNHWSTHAYTMKFLAPDEAKLFNSKDNAWCVTPENHTTPEGTYNIRLIDGDADHKAMRKLMWYAAANSGTWNNGKGSKAISNTDAYVHYHLILSLCWECICSHNPPLPESQWAKQGWTEGLPASSVQDVIKDYKKVRYNESGNFPDDNVPDTFKAWVADQSVSAGRQMIMGWYNTKNYEPKGNVAVYKHDDKGNNLAGAIFRLTGFDGNAKGKVHDLPATDANGEAHLDQIETGKYHVTEIQAPPGFSPAANIPDIEVRKSPKPPESGWFRNVIGSPDGKSIFYIVNTPPTPGEGHLYKVCNPDSNSQDLVKDNTCYSLKGAKYHLSGTGTEHIRDATQWTPHEDESHTVSEDAYTDEGGNFSFSSTVWAGTYKVTEVKPSPGYMLPDNPTHTYTVDANCSSGRGSSDQTTGSWDGEWDEPPRNDPLMLSVTKRVADNEPGVPVRGAPQAGDPVVGAVYELRFYGNYDGSGEPLRVWYYQTDSSGKFDMRTSSLYNDENYHSDALYHNRHGQVTLPLGTVKCEEVIAPEGYSVDRTVYVGHCREDDSKSEGATFTWDGSTSNWLVTTNAATHKEKLTATISSLATAETGIDPDGVNTEQDRITNNHHVLRWSSSGIKETMYCKNLTPGWTYELVGTIMDMETGQQAAVDGSRVRKMFTTPGSFSETYQTTDCTVDLDFNINTNLLEGHTLVLFARLYEVSTHYDHATGQSVYYYEPDPNSIASDPEYGYVAHHEDWMDEKETIYVPKMRTSVANNDATFGVKYMNPDATSVTLTDTITMSGLKPNTTYTAYGTLMDTEYREPLLENGKRILGHTTFTTGSSTGSYPNHGVSQVITVTFTFNPQNITGHEGNRRFYKNHLGELRGQDLTVFEHLTLGGYTSPYDTPVVAKHEVYPTLDKETRGTHAGEEYYDGNVFTDNYHDHNNDDIGDVSEVRQTLRWLGEITLRKRTNAGQVTKEGAYFKLQKWNGTDWVDYICEAGKPMDKWTVSQSPYIVKSDETGIARFTQLKDSPTPTTYSYRVIEIKSPDNGEVGLLKDPIDYVLWRGHSVYCYTPGSEVYTEDALGNQERRLIDNGIDDDMIDNPQNFMDAHRSSTDGYTYVTIFDNGHVVLYAGGVGRKSLYIAGGVMSAILAGLYLGLKIRRKKLI